jgi:predicted ester cyclase
MPRHHESTKSTHHTRRKCVIHQVFGGPPPATITSKTKIAEGDKVVTRLTSYGKHEGDLAGAPRTGHDMRVTSTAIHRVLDGKLVEK